MKITIVDTHLAVIVALRGLPAAGVEYRHGNIFDQPAAAIVSPANSFGFMDGGIDLAYSHRFGWGVQAAVQRTIQQDFDGELLVGQALAVSTGDPDFPTLISAPTMRVPMVIPNPTDVRLAARAAVRLALSLDLESLVMPGLGTGSGQVKPEWAAHMMLAGIADALNPAPFPATLSEAVRRHRSAFP